MRPIMTVSNIKSIAIWTLIIISICMSILFYDNNITISELEIKHTELINNHTKVVDSLCSIITNYNNKLDSISIKIDSVNLETNSLKYYYENIISDFNDITIVDNDSITKYISNKIHN